MAVLRGSPTVAGGIASDAPGLLHDHLLVVGDHPLADGVVAAAARRQAPVTWITNGRVSRPIPGVEIVPGPWGIEQADRAATAARAIVAFADEARQL